MKIDTDARIPLRVGDLFTGAFARFFERPLLYMALALGPSVLATVLNILATDTSQGSVFLGLAMVIPQTALSAVGSALVIYAGLDAHQGKPARPLGYLGATLSVMLPLVVLNIVAMLLIYGGLLLLVVPGLYALGLFAVVMPAILIEGAGWSGLRRSQDLTQGYRWPVCGAVIMISLVLLAGLAVGGGVLALVSGASTAEIMGGTSWTWRIAEPVLNAAFMSILALFTLGLYLRLKEIREGGAPSEMVEVFR